MKKNYYFKQLGKVSKQIEEVKLSTQTLDILNGKYDNEPIDSKMPNIAKLQAILKEKEKEKKKN